MNLEFDIAVIASKRRKALVLDHLKNIPYIINYTPDYDLPDNWKPESEYEHLVRHMHGHTGQHRCLEGHKDVLKLTTKDTILVLEDDAVPIKSNWLAICKLANRLLNQFEIVSMHSREVNHNGFNKAIFDSKYKLALYSPKDLITPKWALGSLAYFIKRKDIQRIYDHNYNGLPMDIFLCNCFNFAFISPSPFKHDRSQGSLIDK